MDPLAVINTRTTPQNTKADVRQILNNAGGYVFKIGDEARLRRFLTLGTEGGTYYTSEKEITVDNAAVVFRMAENDPATLLREIVAISTGGRAPKQNPAIFALAVAASVGSTESKRAALDSIPVVCRTGTHLFLFAGYVEQFRGWGRSLRRAVAEWYTSGDVSSTTYQAVKYRNRGGWSHRDLLRLSHPVGTTPEQNALFSWIAQGTVGEHTPALVTGFLKAQEPGADIASLLQEYSLSWEMLPSEALTKASTWEALIENNRVPATALMRQLPRLTNLGLLPQMGGLTDKVSSLLIDKDRLKKGRIHPFNVLVAHRTYESGKSYRGSSTWTPTPKITDALNDAFYVAFDCVEPAGKRTLLAVDVSPSMANDKIAGSNVSPREASAALALVQTSTEPSSAVVGFASGKNVLQLGISPKQRLADAIRSLSGLPWGGTDCSLPVRTAMKQGLEIDTFVIYTDNETWAGPQHVHQSLVEYREKMGVEARMIVVGMTATECSIANPSDPLTIDIAGMDSATPNMINAFSRGDI